jgi:hypothetical protein
MSYSLETLRANTLAALAALGTGNRAALETAYGNLEPSVWRNPPEGLSTEEKLVFAAEAATAKCLLTAIERAVEAADLHYAFRPEVIEAGKRLAEAMAEVDALNPEIRAYWAGGEFDNEWTTSRAQVLATERGIDIDYSNPTVASDVDDHYRRVAAPALAASAA